MGEWRYTFSDLFIANKNPILITIKIFCGTILEE
jgi:hypothetical protein